MVVKVPFYLDQVYLSHTEFTFLSISATPFDLKQELRFFCKYSTSETWSLKKNISYHEGLY